MNNDHNKDNSPRELLTQLNCMTPTWVLLGISILKFSVDSAQNVKSYPIDQIHFFESTV